MKIVIQQYCLNAFQNFLGPSNVVQEEQICGDSGQCGGRDEAGDGGCLQREEHPEVEAVSQPRAAGGDSLSKPREDASPGRWRARV